jgi:hypothetical protein
VLKVGMAGSATWTLAPGSACAAVQGSQPSEEYLEDFREIWRILGEGVV